jgi:hypothetical protein
MLAELVVDSGLSINFEIEAVDSLVVDTGLSVNLAAILENFEMVCLTVLSVNFDFAVGVLVVDSVNFEIEAVDALVVDSGLLENLDVLLVNIEVVGALVVDLVRLAKDFSQLAKLRSLPEFSMLLEFFRKLQKVSNKLVCLLIIYLLL